MKQSWWKNSFNSFKITHTKTPSIFLTSIRTCIIREYCIAIYFCLVIIDNWLLFCCTFQTYLSSIKFLSDSIIYFRTKKFVVLNMLLLIHDSWITLNSATYCILYKQIYTAFSSLGRQRLLAVSFCLPQKLSITLECGLEVLKSLGLHMHMRFFFAI